MTSAPPKRVAAPELSINNLRVESPSGRVLLQIDHLTLAPGASVAIQGPSGAGKSTLLFAMAGLLPIASGSLRWGQQELLRMADSARSAFRQDNLGIIFQDHMLFEELTPTENAAISSFYAKPTSRAAIKSSARSLLHSLGVPLKPRRKLTGYSGGERQRIAVARALANDPPVILADEPTASLDRATADALIKDLHDGAQQTGRSLIVVSHDPVLIAATERVITLQDGRITQDG